MVVLPLAVTIFIAILSSPTIVMLLLLKVGLLKLFEYANNILLLPVDIKLLFVIVDLEFGVSITINS